MVLIDATVKRDLKTRGDKTRGDGSSVFGMNAKGQAPCERKRAGPM